MAVGPLAHGYFAFKFNLTQSLVAEEETHDEKPTAKAKQDLKHTYFSSISFHQHSTADLLKASRQRYLIFLSKGYVGTPFLPPDMI